MTFVITSKLINVYRTQKRPQILVYGVKIDCVSCADDEFASRNEASRWESQRATNFRVFGCVAIHSHETLTVQKRMRSIRNERDEDHHFTMPLKAQSVFSAPLLFHFNKGPNVAFAKGNNRRSQQANMHLLGGAKQAYVAFLRYRHLLGRMYQLHCSLRGTLFALDQDGRIHLTLFKKLLAFKA